jgi:hypothetical protein
MTKSTATVPSLGDRYAEWTVILVTILALVAGWAFKSSVENRSVAFESNTVSAMVPAGWMQSQTGGELLHVNDRVSTGFRTTYLIAEIPTTLDAEPGKVAGLLNLQRAQELDAYRVLSQEAVTVGGRDAYKTSYVFVVSDPNLTRAVLPKVVLGADYIFMDEGKAIVVTYWADQDNYDYDLARFYRFLSTVAY